MNMKNLSAVKFFIMTAYTELEDNRYLFIVCFIFLYIMILLINSVLFLAIYSERSLHEPMHLFICNLSVNGVFGSTILLPSILNHLLSQNYEISLTHCLLQIYGIYLYAIVEFTILAEMSYDRYVAICHPLHYHLLMSPRKVFTAIALSWFIPCLYFALLFISTVRLSFCKKQIEKVYCSNFQFQKMACSDSSVEILVGLSLTFVCPGLQVVLILFSYAQILKICLSASKESQTKALQTCTPHLVTVINYTLGVLFEVFHSSFMSSLPYKIGIFLSLYFLIIPPLCNPVIYGISIQAVRLQILKMFIRNGNNLFCR